MCFYTKKLYPFLLQDDHIVCVAGMILKYFEEEGLFKFHEEYYATKNTDLARLTKSFDNHFIATCQPNNILAKLDEGKLGEVPCNVKWSNTHRIDPNANTSCIHFSAASNGTFETLDLFSYKIPRSGLVLHFRKNFLFWRTENFSISPIWPPCSLPKNAFNLRVGDKTW